MKKISKPSLTVAIPAFNEEAGIGSVLDQLVRQTSKNFNLSKIIVYSDASTDRTEEIVRKRQSLYKQICLETSRKRSGKIAKLNEMFKNLDSDFLVVLDADIFLCGENFLDQLVLEITRHPLYGMVAAHQIMKRPDNFLGKIIHADFSMWDRVRFSFPNYKSVHNFYGAGTIYRKTFASTIKLPEDLGDDERGYLYLSSLRYGGFGYTTKSKLIYHPPSSFQDQINLHKRTFGKNLDRLTGLFGQFVNYEYEIPRRYKLKGLLLEIIYNPLFAILAIGENLLIKNFSLEKRKPTGIWEMLGTTKRPFKKIVISNYDSMKHPIYGGGGALVIHEFAKRLTENFEVTILTNKYDKSVGETIDKVKYKRIGTTILGARWGQVVFAPLLVVYLFKEGFDIWLENLVPPLGSFFLDIFSRKPVITMVHMLPAKDMERKYGIPVKWWENIVLRIKKQFIVTTEESKKEIRKVNKKAQISVIPNGIELPKRLTKKMKHILFIGRLEFDQKGFDLMLPAFAKSQTKNKMPLIIAGGGQDEKRIKSLVKELDIEKCVHFAGKVQGSKKNRLISEAAMVIVPSRFETRSQTALEAMAFGKRLICFDIPGFKWIPRNACIKVAKFSIPGLTRAIDLPIETSNFRGREFAKAFDIGRVTELYKNFIYGRLN